MKKECKRLIVMLVCTIIPIIIMLLVFFFFTKRYVVIFETTNGIITDTYYKTSFGSKVETIITPYTGYVFSEVTGCENATYYDNKLIVKNIRKDLVCNVVFHKENKKVSINTLNANVVGNPIINVEYGEDAIFIVETKNNYYFSESTCKNTNYDSSTNKLTIANIKENMNCSITFSDYVVVTFNTNGAGEIESQRLMPNEKLSKPEDPVKEGYVFKGWYYNGNLYDFDTNLDTSITLEAKWTRFFDVTLKYINIENGESNLEAITKNIEDEEIIRIPVSDYSDINPITIKDSCIINCPLVIFEQEEIVIKYLTNDITVDVLYKNEEEMD